MKLLIGVKGCWRDTANGFHDAIRETWARHVHGADFRFFVGDGQGHLHEDEVQVPAPDDYMGLPHKTRAILGWSLARGYDFVFLCDTDTYVIPERLMSSGFEGYDLTGLFNGAIGAPRATEGDAGHWQPADQPNGATRYWAWISGGNGYWLSRRASEIVLNHPHTGDWAEDRIVGQALGPHFQSGVLRGLNHMGYGFCYDADYWRTDVSSHYCTAGMHRKFDPVWMRNRYAYNVLGGRGMQF